MAVITSDIETHVTSNACYLISPLIDSLMIGGLSLIFFGVCYRWFQTGNRELVLAIYYLAFAINFPHFLVSYQLLYIDARQFIFKRFRFFWAAIIAPILLLFAMFWLATYQPEHLGILVNLMVFLVGWHYIKQIFGGVIVASALQKFYFKPFEKCILQINLYCLWLVSWLSINIGMKAWFYYWIPYWNFNLPPILLAIVYSLLIATACAVVIMQTLKFMREKQLPPLSAFLCFSSAYVWFLPTLYNPLFFLAVPLFHSLQYLLFVYVIKRNEFRINPAKNYASFKFYSYLFMPIITGALGFTVIPNVLDHFHVFHFYLFGPTFAAFLFTIFFNVHHYFIDNVIWKRNNPMMQNYLFKHQ